MKRACSFLFIFTFCIVAGAVDPLPSDRTPARRGSWAGLVGVPGGIPKRTNIYQSFSSGASVSAINSAIAACPSNQVVYLGPGTYSGTITINKSGVTLRGAGINTIINGNIEVGDWHVWDSMTANPSTGNHVNWTAGLSQGSSSITVASTSGYSVGQIIVLDQLNDTNTSAWNNESSYSPNKAISVAYPNDGHDRIQFQVNRIAAISGNDITLENPVYMPNIQASLDPETWRFPSQPPVMSGVENLRCGAFRFHYTYACWATNVMSVACVGDLGTLMCLWSGRNSIQGCTITSSGICSDGYGLELRACAGLLIENNIIDKIGPGMMPNSTQGSVIAYNVITNVTSASAWMSAGFLNHGSFPCMNLLEGNAFPEIQWDNTDGPSGYNVSFRNWCQGIDQARTAYGNVQAMVIEGTNRNHSVIGNVLGTAGVTYAAYQDGPNCSGGKRIYMVGFWRAECSTPYDPLTASTLIRAYNWDEYNDAVVTGGYSASDIPNSYYLTSKPAWFGNLAWPPVVPDNPTYSRSWTNIPAGYRQVFGVGPPTGPVLTLNSISVTPVNPSITNSTQQFTATGAYSDGSTSDISGQVTWGSSNPGVATINASGLATSVSAGNTTITATLGSVSGNTTLTVQSAPLRITTSSLPNGTVSVAYLATLAGSGGTTPYTWSTTSGTLPAGLVLNINSGTITGAPSVAGTNNFTIQMRDSSGPVQTATNALSIVVTPTLSSITVTPSNPTITSGNTQQFTATGTYSDGSTQNINNQVTWASSNLVVATINSSGLATCVSVGSTMIRATLGSVSNNTTLIVQSAPLRVTTGSLPNGTVSVAYLATLAASGGTTPYTWSITSGTLPSGLALSINSGTITGTPGVAGTNNFTIQVRDSSNPIKTATNELNLTVTTASSSGILGNTNDGTAVDYIWSGGAWINASRFQAGSNMTVSTVRAKVAAIAGEYKCAIYTDSSGQPSQLLSSTDKVSNPGTGWRSLPLTSQLALTNGQYYWLAIWSDDANAQVYYSDTTGTLRWGEYNYGAWPDTISTSGGSNLKYCIHATSEVWPRIPQGLQLVPSSN